jgi:hypothetical protein
MKLKKLTFLIFFLLPQIALAMNPTVKKFDHELHDRRVFIPQHIECSSCHNMEKDKATGHFKMTDNISNATFKKPLKRVCHECHKVSDNQYNPEKGEKAPKTCYTCHDTFQQISNIKPQSHQNKLWKKSHGLSARVESASCMNCHSTSQCSVCHTQRNDITPKNHMRNYRFFHSVEARLSPQKCDACHSKSYCTTCHLGKK